MLSEIHLSEEQRSFTVLARTDSSSLRKVSKSYYFQSNEAASALRPLRDSGGL